MSSEAHQGGDTSNDTLFHLIRLFPLGKEASVTDTEGLQAVRVASRVLQSQKAHVYTRGLAARLITLVMGHGGLSEARKEVTGNSGVISALLDTFNKAFACAELSPSDRHRVCGNCAKALAHIYSTEKFSGSQFRHFTGTLDMGPRKEDLPPPSPQAGYRGFWADPILSETAEHENLVPQTRGEVARSTSALSGTRPSARSIEEISSEDSLSTRDLHFGTRGRRDFKRPRTPLHRPVTRFSNIAGSMGLYDEYQQQKLSAKKNQHDLRSQEDEDAAKGEENRSRPSTTYTEFIRTMLSTPLQGAPTVKRLKPPTPALAELAHIVRRNWNVMPRYLEALGLLRSYPMGVDQMSPKVRRVAKKIKHRELSSHISGSYKPETNSGVLLADDPAGLGNQSSAMFDARRLGYSKSMMWFPQNCFATATRGALVTEEEEPATVYRHQVSLVTWGGGNVPLQLPLVLSRDMDTGISSIEEEDLGELDTFRAAAVIEERVRRAPEEIQRLDQFVARVRGQQRGISRLLYLNIDQLRQELPMKFLLHLKSNSMFPEFDVQLIRDRAFLMLAAWAEEMRLRALAAALVPWWQLVVYQRAREYRAGVGVRLMKVTLYRCAIRPLRRRFLLWVRVTAWRRHVQRDRAAAVIQKMYRGYKGRLTFLELLRRHLACIPIQTMWRRIWQRATYVLKRQRAIVVQARARGLIQRRIIAEWHRVQRCGLLHPHVFL